MAGPKIFPLTGYFMCMLTTFSRIFIFICISIRFIFDHLIRNLQYKIWLSLLIQEWTWLFLVSMAPPRACPKRDFPFPCFVHFCIRCPIFKSPITTDFHELFFATTISPMEDDPSCQSWVLKTSLHFHMSCNAVLGVAEGFKSASMTLLMERFCVVKRGRRFTEEQRKVRQERQAGSTFIQNTLLGHLSRFSSIPSQWPTNSFLLVVHHHLLLDIRGRIVFWSLCELDTLRAHLWILFTSDDFRENSSRVIYACDKWTSLLTLL